MNTGAGTGTDDSTDGRGGGAGRGGAGRGGDRAGAVAGARGCLAAVVGAAAGLLTWLRTVDRGAFVGFEGEGRDFSQLWVGLPLMVLGGVVAALVIGAAASRFLRGVGVAVVVLVALGLLTWAAVEVDAWHDERTRPVRLLERGVGCGLPAAGCSPTRPFPKLGASPQTPWTPYGRVLKRRTG